MRRGVSHCASASRAAASAIQRIARQRVYRTRQWLIATMIFVALLLPLAVSGAPQSTVEVVSARPQPYAAWSCRGIYHVVRRGETIYSIARRYGTTAYRIAVCNGLGSYTVYVGQTLLVPTAR